MAESNSSDFQRELLARVLALPMVQDAREMAEQERERAKRQAEQHILSLFPASAVPTDPPCPTASNTAAAARLLVGQRHKMTSPEKKAIRAKAKALIQLGTRNHSQITTVIMREGEYKASRGVIKTIVKEECEDAGRTDLIQGHPDYQPPGKKTGFP